MKTYIISSYRPPSDELARLIRAQIIEEGIIDPDSVSIEEFSEDEREDAITGDADIAYSLFYDLQADNPDRVYYLDAYTNDYKRDPSDKINRAIRDFDGDIHEHIVSVRGTSKEDQYTIKYFYEHEALEETLEEFGLGADA